MTTEPLRLGAFGGQMPELHAGLTKQGFDIPSSEVQRAFFGPATHRAVVAAQSAAGLTSTGVVDPATAEILGLAPGRPPGARPTLPVPDGPTAGPAVHIGIPDALPIQPADQAGVVGNVV